eukprot:TRINITY_DN32898_c0_g1_i1.p1 TRINITY_DN32898_c0_g1~~TRINITY_DN32898_c0_g1_i1.p1  ORF type:complete len:301 (+),score=68.23 TRINITY_DN32898_c0_g1_i1:46-903(+)
MRAACQNVQHLRRAATQRRWNQQQQQPPSSTEENVHDTYEEQRKMQEAAFARLEKKREEGALSNQMDSVSTLHGRRFSDETYDYDALSGNVYDYIVVGTGYAGSIFALRMAQKGYSVLAVEEGQRFEGASPNNDWELAHSMWKPSSGLYGLQRTTPLGALHVKSGVGIGGSSLVNESTLEHPDLSLFAEEPWAQVTSPEEMGRYYAEAQRMLGVAEQPFVTEPDKLMMTAAEELGIHGQCDLATAAVFLGSRRPRSWITSRPSSMLRGTSRPTPVHGHLILGVAL